MGRAPCCDKASVKKGPWSPEEDAKLKSYIDHHGIAGNWIALPQKIGLKRCGKSCRLRWLNYLRPDIKHGGFSEEEDEVICNLYVAIGSRWSIIASQLPGRTDNDIKNYWNTKLKKKLFGKQCKERRQARGGSGTKSKLESYSTFSRFLPPEDQAIVGHSSPDQNIFRRLFSGHPSMGIVSIDSADCGADHRVVDQLHANFLGSVDAFPEGQFPLLQRCEEAALDLEGLLCGNSASPEVADGGVNSFVSRGSSYSSLLRMNWNDQANPLIDHHDLPLPFGFLGEEEEPALPHFGVSLS